MKEIIVIPKDKIKVLTSCDCFPANGYFTFYKEDVEVEQVPESWEELKELCKGITVDVTVCKDGTVYCYEYCIAKNRTPAQMWQIIKSLIGEE